MNPVEAAKTFFGLNCHCLNRKHNCDDHTFSSLHVLLQELIPYTSPEEVAPLAPVVQTLDSAIHWINHYPLDNSIGFASVYPLDRDLSGGQRYPSFEQLGPGQYLIHPL